MSTEASRPPAVRLRIEPILSQAADLERRVAAELPTHQGLANAAGLVVRAAGTAQSVAAAMKRPLSLHRLPVLFLAAALLGLGAFLVWQLAWSSTLTLALPDRDAAHLKEELHLDGKVAVQLLEVPGSREAVDRLVKGTVDLGFVQGGVPIPPRLARLELPDRELVLFFLRPGLDRPTQVKKVLTSVKGEGSEAVAEAFFAAWGLSGTVELVHGWTALTAGGGGKLGDDLDGVFVVKDPADPQTLAGVARVTAAGFRLITPPLGARGARLDYLAPATIPPGYFAADPPNPRAPVETYSVATYLVAREGLTPRRLSQAAEVVAPHPHSIADGSFHFTTGEASTLLQGIDAFLSILVNIALAFLALLGLDVVAYRRHFHELNTLVSLVSMLQSSKDVLGLSRGPRRAENLLYMRLCSDLLGLISAIGGYYTQENSSLLFNNLSEVVHQRCDALKINIQLKLLHALVDA